jgi:hypothetical protein
LKPWAYVINVPAVHLLEAVRVQRQADDLFHQPIFILPRQVGSEFLLELQDQILVDLPDEGLYGGHDGSLFCQF